LLLIGIDISKVKHDTYVGRSSAVSEGGMGMKSDRNWKEMVQETIRMLWLKHRALGSEKTYNG